MAIRFDRKTFIKPVDKIYNLRGTCLAVNILVSLNFSLRFTSQTVASVNEQERIAYFSRLWRENLSVLAP